MMRLLVATIKSSTARPTPAQMNGKSKRGGSGAERRRHERFAVSIDAKLSVSGRPAISVVIKDFSIAGMFVQVDEAALARIKATEKALLAFRIEPEGRGKLYELKVGVARVIPAGIGVSFDDAPAATIKLLEKHARRYSGADEEENLTDTQRRFAPGFMRLLPSMIQIVDRFGERLIKEFPRVGAEALFAAARDAGTNQLSRVLLDAEAIFTKSSEGLRAQVPGLLRQAASSLSNPLAKKGRAVPDARSLTLVDKEEFELYLFVSGAASQLEMALKPQLHELNMRLSMLAHRVVESSNNPFGPVVICNVAAEGVKQYLSEAYPSEVVFNGLRRMLEIDLKPFYNELNGMLEQAGIEMLDDPDKPVVSKRSEDRKPDKEEKLEGKAETPPEAIDFEAELKALKESVTRITGDLLPGASPAVSSVASMPVLPLPPATGQVVAPTAMLPESLVGASLGVTSEIPTGGFGEPVRPGEQSVFPRGVGAAFSQLRMRRQLGGAAARLAGPAAAAGATSTAAVASGSSAGVPGLPPLLETLDIDPAAELAGLASDLGAVGAPSSSASQPQSEGAVIADGLLENLVADPRVATVARGQLLRLAHATREAAALDDSFIVRPDHPLRQIINRMAEVREVEPMEPVRERLDAIVQGIEQKGLADSARLQTALADIEALLAEQAGDFQHKVDEIVRESAEEQRVIRERRERAGLPPTPAPRQDLSPDWSRWLKRARALRVGQDFLMDANTQLPYPVSLVWVGEDFTPYVFVDRKGMKALTLTLEQVAMYLRREVLQLLEAEAAPLDRAMAGVVTQLHEQIAEEASHDSATRVLNRRGLLDLLEAEVSAEGTVLCVCAFDAIKMWADLMTGSDVLDPAMATLVARLQAHVGGKPIALARLEPSLLGFYWSGGGLDSAQRDLDEIIPLLGNVSLGNPPEEMATGAVFALAALPAQGGRRERWLERLVTALEQAREESTQRLVIDLLEEPQQRQLQQLKAYVERSVQKERLQLACHEVRSLRGAAALTARIAISVEDRAGKLVPPSMVSDALADPGVAWRADQWTLAQALAWLATQPLDGGSFQTIILPLSAAALARDDLADLVVQQLMETAVPPARVCFAINERDAVAQQVEVADFIDSLKEFGCQFALEDFGSSQTDHGHLRRLAVDFLVLRHGMLEDARRNTKDLAIVRSLNEMGHFLGKLTIASQGPGPSIAEIAQELGVDFLLDQTRVLRLGMN